MDVPVDYVFLVRSNVDGLTYFMNLFQLKYHERTGEIPPNAICESTLNQR